MNPSLKPHFLRRYAAGIALLVIASCDVFEQDALQPEDQVVTGQTEYYTLPEKSVVIDLKSVFTASYVNATVKITQSPVRGVLTELGPLLLRYKPSTAFKEGADQFVVSVLSNGQVLKTEKLTITLKNATNDLPCSLYAVEDIVNENGYLPLTISLLDNDWICGVDYSDLVVSIHIGPKHGEADLFLQTSIVYTPDPNFNGYDELVYRVASSDGNVVSYGLVSIIDPQNVIDIDVPTVTLDGWRSQVLNLPSSYKYFNTMFFLDENTGFVARGSISYKTTDGGVSWTKADGGLGRVSDICFLDFNNWFVSNGAGTLQHTTDGGVSWNAIHVDSGLSIRHVFFTSATTGIVAGTTCEGYWDLDYETKILKTTDGGATWKEMLVLPFHDFSFRNGLIFSNHNAGIASQFEWDPLQDGGYLRGKLFWTTDGGESWELAAEDSMGGPYAISKTNMIYAAIDRTYPTGNSKSSVAKSQDALSWHSLADFQHNIASIKFSPSGQLLFTAGIKGNWYYQSAYTLSISMSIDGGETWRTIDTGLTVGEGDFSGAAPMPSIAIPSDRVVYVEYGNRLIKYWKP